MARVKTNPIIEQVRGAVGDLVFKRYGDDVVVARKADPSEKEPTEAQTAHREQFRQATLYGKMVQADPATKAIYEEAAKAQGKPAFSLMVADFFRAPSVDEVDVNGYSGKVGDEIVIQAHDDFEVSNVTVAITNASGQAIENGAATETPSKSGRWVYKAPAAVPTGTMMRIDVTAMDRPGHTGTKQVSKP